MSKKGDEYTELVSTLIGMMSNHTLDGEYRAGDPSGTREIRLRPITILGGTTVSSLLLIVAKPAPQPQDRLIEGTVYLFNHTLLTVTKLTLQGYYEAVGTESAHFSKPTLLDLDNLDLSDPRRAAGDRVSLQELQYLRDVIWAWPSNRRG